MNNVNTFVHKDLGLLINEIEKNQPKLPLILFLLAMYSKNCTRTLPRYRTKESTHSEFIGKMRPM
jgi:hypothetical protein